MGVITRLDGRSIKNSYFHIKDESGYILATVQARGSKAELEVRTAPNLHIEKANGFRSNMNVESNGK